MSHALERLIDRFAQRSVRLAPLEVTASSGALVIRLARDEDLAQLRDLAALDSAEPLTGPAIVAIVDDRPVAALGLVDERVIADPFEATVEAVALLRLRVRQLHASRRQPAVWRRRRRVTRRVGAR